jgi:hypothetical protein
MFQTTAVEKIKINFVFRNFIENCAVYDITWKNILEPERSQVTMWCLSIICWIPKAADTNSEYVILIAFPLQQWLHERVTLLYARCLSC